MSHPTFEQLKPLGAAFRQQVTEHEFDTKLELYTEIMSENPKVNDMFKEPNPNYTLIVKTIISLAV